MPFYTPRPTSPSFRHTLDTFLHSQQLPFSDVLTEEQIRQACEEEQVPFGTGAQHVWSVPLTLWAFLTQAGSESKSCVAAVARVLTLLTTLGQALCSAGTSAYCKARAKLSEGFLRRLVGDVARQLVDAAPPSWRWHGHAVELIDGSTLSMPDTRANQAVYPQSRSQRPGVGFPILRWVARIDWLTGAVLDAAFGPYRGKQTGESALFRTLLDKVRAGSVLVADRYYCSYWMVALALRAGIHVVFRKHQLRHTDFRQGRRLGRDDHVVSWTKPQRPEWMDAATYEALPATLTLREVRGRVRTPGYRVRELVVMTDRLDAGSYPIEDILELYHQRWHAEIDLRSLKTQMRMEILRCQTPEMVRKEIWAHLLAYNLVRKVMAQAAALKGWTPRQVSFAGAMQTLNEFRTLLLTVTDSAAEALLRQILEAIGSHRVGQRPNRVEPRKVKRRPKGYSRMLRPRAEERAELLND
jgi:putative transposase